MVEQTLQWRLLVRFSTCSNMDILTAITEMGPLSNSLRTILGLFDFMPNIYFYIKDRDRRFLWMNDPLRQFLGANSIEECLGKKDFDFFSPDRVFLYHQEDDAVIASRCPLLHQPWIVPGKTGQSKWFLSSKIPLFDADGQVVILAGIMQDIVHEFAISHPVGEMQTVIDHIVENYHEQIDITTLASLTFLSTRQFERRFRSLFHVSPGEFILKVRIDAAIRLLMDDEIPITQIALQCGFYDNSHFTRLFKYRLGVSPTQFRKKFA